MPWPSTLWKDTSAQLFKEFPVELSPGCHSENQLDDTPHLDFPLDPFFFIPDFVSQNNLIRSDKITSEQPKARLIISQQLKARLPLAPEFTTGQILERLVAP